MRIGILTFYREINFGANLQALSTYYYLKRIGHEPIFVRYETVEKEKIFGPIFMMELQPSCHCSFIDNIGVAQTQICRTSADINKEIEKREIEAIIVGSDAVVQHCPFLLQFSFSKRRILRRKIVFPEQKFPNPFWGVGINPDVKMAMMSVSNQDSMFYKFSFSVRERMKNALKRFSYISARDEWTKAMLLSLIEDQSLSIKVTPDPVFNINDNLNEIIPDEEYIRNKYSLPDKYVLISLHDQCLTLQQLKGIKDGMKHYNLDCIALPMPLGYNFVHPFNYEIKIPLPPLDWYALIKYSNGYVGNNMHPIVSSLHNAVPCFSIDIYGARDFWGKPRKDVTSKVLDIMTRFGVEKNVRKVVRGKCDVRADEVVSGLISFPVDSVKRISEKFSNDYKQMMINILDSFN